MRKKTAKIVTVVGARPQFVKAATVSRAIEAHNCAGEFPEICEKIVHTGQHYDNNMSQVFFDELQIPRPAINLDVGSGSHGIQTGAMLEKLEKVLLDEHPDCVLLYGDTNSTLAGALAAVKLHIPVAHVEAGLRSFNRKMPEEINRMIADCVSTILFCPTDTAVRNLSNEGITSGVFNVGDVMYDSVLFNSSLADSSSDVMNRLNLEPKSFYLATVHRPENTDNPQRLEGILSAFRQIDRSIILPLHPRTRNTLGANLTENIGKKVRLIDPVPYLDMIMLEKNARLILTDSGGVQKEAYWFNVPCITLRDETEWVELVEKGFNTIVGANTEVILQEIRNREKSGNTIPDSHDTPLYGDGHSARAIVKVLSELPVQ